MSVYTVHSETLALIIQPASEFLCQSSSSAHGRHHVGVVRVPEGRVYGGGSGQHVSSVAEGRQVSHGHGSGQGRGAEGGRLVVHAFGKLLVAVAAALVLLGLVGHFAVARLYSLLLHGQRSVHLFGGEERR